MLEMKKYSQHCAFPLDDGGDCCRTGLCLWRMCCRVPQKSPKLLTPKMMKGYFWERTPKRLYVQGTAAYHTISPPIFQPTIYNNGSWYCEKSQDAPFNMSVIDQAVVVDWARIKMRSIKAARCSLAMVNNLKRGVCVANECTVQAQNHGGRRVWLCVSILHPPFQPIMIPLSIVPWQSYRKWYNFQTIKNIKID
jgi:hypothetical protein